MTDVLPVVFVGADEDLVIQLIGRHGQRGHVRRKLEKSGQAFDAKETKTARKCGGRGVFVLSGKNKSPFSEARDVHVVRIRLKAGLLESFRNAPEGVAGKHRRSTLDNQKSLHAEMAGGGTIKRGGVELAERIIRGIGKIDDDEIETVGVLIDPGKSDGVDDTNARRQEGFVVEPGEHGMRREEFRHLGIEIDQGDAFDLGILQDFADGEAVAAAEDQDAPRRGNGRKARMDESFVVTVLVARAELEMAVEKEAKIILEPGEDEMLIASVAGEDDVVGVDVVFGGGSNAAGVGHADSEAKDDDGARQAQSARAGKLR